MKNVLFFFSFSLITLLISCKKEADRDQFIGTYNVSQICSGGPNSSYQIVITEVGEGESVTIDNFANLGFKVSGVCNGDKVTFSQHSGIVPVDGTNVTFNTSDGQGTFVDGVLTIPFSFTGTNGWADSCTMTCTKQ